MSGNGQSEAVLSWPRKVLSADDLRHHLNGHRELALLPRTIITPLAADELKARGVRIVWQEAKAEAVAPAGGWGYAEERPDPQVAAAVQALGRDGLSIVALQAKGSTPCDWARAIAVLIARAECRGGVVFCGDPGLVCCVANKVAGLRAAAAVNVAQATRARASLGANLVAVEMPGRTFFELRQILRAVCGTDKGCPDPVANALKELDGHAHR
jgi:hypothetical protein